MTITMFLVESPVFLVIPIASQTILSGNPEKTWPKLSTEDSTPNDYKNSPLTQCDVPHLLELIYVHPSNYFCLFFIVRVEMGVTMCHFVYFCCSLFIGFIGFIGHFSHFSQLSAAEFPNAPVDQPSAPCAAPRALRFSLRPSSNLRAPVRPGK